MPKNIVPISAISVLIEDIEWNLQKNKDNKYIIKMIQEDLKTILKHYKK